MAKLSDLFGRKGLAGADKQAGRSGGRNGNGGEPPPADSGMNTRLKADELTALTRYMTAAVDTTDPHELIRLALRTVVHQTAARVAGYLSLDPTDPTPKLVLPDQAAVDVPLSKKLTERVRAERRLIWLFADPEAGDKMPSPTESLSAFTDALCLPLAAAGEPFAALHVYRTGMGFADRDVRFIRESVPGRSVDAHRALRDGLAERAARRGRGGRCHAPVRRHASAGRDVRGAWAG